jgi:hypothetical protein
VELLRERELLEIGEQGAARLLRVVRTGLRVHSTATIGRMSGVSFNHLRNIRDRPPRQVAISKLRAIHAALHELDQLKAEANELFTWAYNESRKIGLRELARRLGFSATYLSKVLLGRTPPSKRMLDRCRLQRSAQMRASDDV